LAYALQSLVFQRKLFMMVGVMNDQDFPPVKINLTDDSRPTNMYYNYTMEAI